MKLIKIIPLMVAAAVSLCACGKVDDFGKKDQNATLTTTTTVSVKPVDKSEPLPEQDSNITTSAPDSDLNSDPVETVIPETTTTKKTTTKKKTTTTKATETTTAPKTEIPDKTEPKPDDEPKADPAAEEFFHNIRVVYNDYEFGVGDRMSEVEEWLGVHAAPSGIVISNLSPDDTADEHYYYGMNIQVKDDIIFSIEITENSFPDDEFADLYAYTVGGISIYSYKNDVENAYGIPLRWDYFNFSYEHDGRVMQVTFGDDDSVKKILITDNNV